MPHSLTIETRIHLKTPDACDTFECLVFQHVATDWMTQMATELWQPHMALLHESESTPIANESQGIVT